MVVESISYKNLNGLTNRFLLSKKANVFVGSNGVGKTTSLDCLAILLFGESFTYDKALEKHIDVKDKSKKIECEMVVDTGSKITDEDGKEVKVKFTFGFKCSLGNDDKFSSSWYVNGSKVTKDKYVEKLCNVFKIPSELLDVEKINVLRCLVDPNCISVSENIGVYNLIKTLTNVISVKDFVESDEMYACIRENLATSGYDIKDAKKTIKTSIDSKNNEIEYQNRNLSELVDKNNEIKFDKDTWNELVDKLNANKDKEKELDNTYNNLALDIKNSVNEDSENDRKFVRSLYEELNVVNNEIQELSKKNMGLIGSINIYKNKIKDNNNLLVEMENEKAKAENATFVVVNCPKCNAIVNQNDKNIFDKNREDYLVEITSQIANVKSDIAQMESDIEKWDKTYGENGKTISTLEKKRDELNAKINDLNGKEIYVSDKTKELSSKLDDVENELIDVRKAINEITTTLNDMKVLSDTYTYNKNNINNINNNIKNLTNSVAILEQKQIVINQFDIDYIKLIESQIEKVFGDVKINMVSEGKNKREKVNCYAIYGEKPLYNYNTAPQLALGCKIINLIKKHLNIGNLPILFDIVDNIGEKALNDILDNANGQIVCTKATFKDDVELSIVENISDLKENI